MPVEIEAKMKVTDLGPTRERLVAAGATLIGEFFERNVFFDTEDRSLLAADEGLRVRSAHNIRSNEHTSIVTFKGPRKHGPLKSRDETEVTVGDLAGANALLECLGFKRTLSFEKHRESWSLGGCRFELDEIPFLGFYVEIEGPKEDTVMKMREQFALADRPVVRASYIALLMTHLQERGETTRDVTFPAEKPAPSAA